MGPLDYMARLHLQRDNPRLHHRKRHPHLLLPDLPDRSPFGHSPVFPSDGLHVVPRQLAASQHVGQVDIGLCLGCLRDRFWYFASGGWYLWIGLGYRQRLQGGWWYECVVVR